MSINSVGNSSMIENIISSSNKKAQERNTGEMGKDQFLNLLITQLRYQDPMNPTDDKEFIGQMAQFSSLEQMQNLNTSFQTIKGVSLLGKTVTATVSDPASNGQKSISGKVTNIKTTSEGVVAIINNQEVPVEKVLEISDEGIANSIQDISKYSSFIGLRVKGVINDSNNYSLNIDGQVKEITKGNNQEEAVLMDSKVIAIDFISPKKYSTFEEKREYLNTQIGEEITVVAKDNDFKNFVKVTGKLKEFEISENGEITTYLDGLRVPVKSIDTVTDPRY